MRKLTVTLDPTGRYQQYEQQSFGDIWIQCGYVPFWILISNPKYSFYDNACLQYGEEPHYKFTGSIDGDHIYHDQPDKEEVDPPLHPLLIIVNEGTLEKFIMYPYGICAFVATHPTSEIETIIVRMD